VHLDSDPEGVGARPIELPDGQICRRCRRPLDWHVDRDTGLTAWRHTTLDVDTGNADHPVDPIPMAGEEVVGVCDFCSQPGARWEYPAESFGTPAYGSIGSWGACETCHALIAAGNWKAVARRAVDGIVRNKPFGRLMTRKVRRAMAADLAGLHGLFRQHRTGPAKALW
jgi:hypothetical protein